MPRLQGAFSTVVMTKKRVYAFRDPAGVRPLVLGQIGDRYCVASESCAFDIIGAQRLRDVAAGRARLDRRGRASARGRSSRARARRSASSSTSTSRARTRGWAATLLQAARGRMGEILAREAPAPDADLVIAVPDSGNAAARGFARAARAAAGRRPDQEPLRRAHVHPARPGAAQARPAAEVQPAAGDRRRPAAGRRRRLDRARQHDAPDRPDAARRGRARGPHADLRAADQAPLPLRDRHVHARGDDRPRPHGRRDRRGARRATRWPTCRSPASTRPSAATATRHCDACFTGDYPLAGTEEANDKFAFERALPLARV